MTNENKLEPFGHFRATPFGWEDCAATDEGAKALYQITPEQALEALGWFSRLEIAQERIAELERQRRHCETMDQAEKTALVRALSESMDALGLSTDESPAQLVDAVKAASGKIAELEAERDRLILAVADHVTVRCEYKRVQDVMVEALTAIRTHAGNPELVWRTSSAALAAVKPAGQEGGRVMRVTITTSNSKPRNKPKVGDRKVINGVMHVLEFERASCGALNKTGGRYHYVWVPAADQQNGGA